MQARTYFLGRPCRRARPTLRAHPEDPFARRPRETGVSADAHPIASRAARSREHIATMIDSAGLGVRRHAMAGAAGPEERGVQTRDYFATSESKNSPNDELHASAKLLG